MVDIIYHFLCEFTHVGKPAMQVNSIDLVFTTLPLRKKQNK